MLSPSKRDDTTTAHRITWEPASSRSASPISFLISSFTASICRSSSAFCASSACSLFTLFTIIRLVIAKILSFRASGVCFRRWHPAAAVSSRKALVFSLFVFGCESLRLKLKRQFAPFLARCECRSVVPVLEQVDKHRSIERQLYAIPQDFHTCNDSEKVVSYR